MKNLLQLVWEALFLSDTPHAQMRDGPKPVPRGLLIVVLIAVAVALVGIVGTALAWASMPNLNDMREAIRTGLEEMQWYQLMPPEGQAAFQQSYDMGWQYIPQVAAPNVGAAALQIILKPITMVIIWLLYGLVAHLFARLLGGRGTLAQTLGCTALAFAPQLLNLTTLLPYITVGGVIGVWTLLMRYIALKTAHQLSWGRAMWATLLPYVVAGLLLAILIAVGVFGAVSAINAGGLQ